MMSPVLDEGLFSPLVEQPDGNVADEKEGYNGDSSMTHPDSTAAPTPTIPSNETYFSATIGGNYDCCNHTS
jgi:hypothetical protein